jgi:hypothetical protein
MKCKETERLVQEEKQILGPFSENFDQKMMYLFGL